MLKIALDIDGVLADTMQIVSEKVVNNFGINPEELKPGDYTNVYRLDNSLLQDEVNKFVIGLFMEDEEVYRRAEEINGAWLGSHILKPVAYITRRPEDNGIGEATKLWLEASGFYKAPVYFIPRGACKSIKAHELGVDVLIEDSPHEITSCRDNGLRTLIMRYDYNDEVITPNSEVAHNWDDVLKWYENNKYPEGVIW